jgi:hypothetical protein
MKNITTFEHFDSIQENVIILWADKVTDNLPKAIKKAKYKGKGGKAWDDQYEINAKEGSGTVFFVDAKNVADAKEKIQGLTKKNNSNVYHVNESHNWIDEEDLGNDDFSINPFANEDPDENINDTYEDDDNYLCPECDGNDPNCEVCDGTGSIDKETYFDWQG